MTTSVCSQCFSNLGFRKVLEGQGPSTGARCPRCNSTSGTFLDIDRLVDSARQFFVYGSVLAETLAPVYNIGEVDFGLATLDPTIASDAILLKDVTGLTVYDNAPPLWRLGYTTHYHQFKQGSITSAADALVKTGEECIVDTSMDLYRVRLNMPTGPTLLDPETFDPPPDEMVRIPGRWNADTTPVLYVSDDVELCVHECRATLSDEIVLASMRPTRPLRVLDVSAGFGSPSDDRFEDGQMFADFMSRSRSGEWLDICRAVGASAKKAGYDGVKYTSYYSFAMDEESGTNLALFGRPIAEGKLALHSVNRLRMEAVKYRVIFGPALYSNE